MFCFTPPPTSLVFFLSLSPALLSYLASPNTGRPCLSGSHARHCLNESPAVTGPSTMEAMSGVARRWPHKWHCHPWLGIRPSVGRDGRDLLQRLQRRFVGARGLGGGFAHGDWRRRWDSRSWPRGHPKAPAAPVGHAEPAFKL